MPYAPVDKTLGAIILHEIFKSVNSFDRHYNSILVSGSEGERVRLRTLIGYLDTPIGKSGNTQVINLRFAHATEVAPILASVGENYVREQKKGKQEGGGGETSIVNVQAHSGNNALVITAPPELHRTLQEVVRKLDIRRAQVQVEAIIAEISSKKAAELGIQWNIFPNNQQTTGPIGGTNFTTAPNTSILQLSANPAGLGTGLNMGYVNGTSVLMGKTYLNLAALLHAMQTDGSTNVLSTPSLVTLDNEEATILVGQNVPFITGNYMTNSTSTQNPFQTIQRQNVGLTLKVKPQINEGDTIRLDIQQEVSSVDTSFVGASDLVTSTRNIKTAVLVENGELLVLGGLMTDNLQKNTEKIPLLGDIPLFGKLFQYQSSNNAKTNLVVFLRPVILRNRQDSALITADKYETIRQRQIEAAEPNLPLGLQSTPPQLPELPQGVAPGGTSLVPPTGPSVPPLSVAPEEPKTSNWLSIPPQLLVSPKEVVPGGMPAVPPTGPSVPSLPVIPEGPLPTEASHGNSMGGFGWAVEH